MRPKRKLLIFSRDDDYAGRLAFVLRQSWRYQTEACSTDLEIAAVLRDTLFDAAVLIGDTVFAGTIRATQPDCRIMLIGPGTHGVFGTPFDAFLPAGTDMFQINEALYTVIARKRGPRRVRQEIPQAVA
jgi:hypothetical protein